MNRLVLQVLLPLIATSLFVGSATSSEEVRWFEQPPESWPPITMINEIAYADQHHPIAGCSFLLRVDGDTLAATAKHILKFFKSSSMDAVDFAGTLKVWKAFPKDQPENVVIFDRLINEDPEESIEEVSANEDWLLFTVGEAASSMQPLELRDTPLEPGEKVFIVGWRYTDKDCPQVIYEGAYERTDDGTVLISTEVLAENTMPGLSGAPVIDTAGRVIGLMSQKAGKLERLSSVEYPRGILAERLKHDRGP